MHLKELRLKNWMIFGGEQAINFADGSSNITVIYGENMHGKTTLLNSIRWAMYEKAINRQGRQIASHDLINKEASKSGETEVGVDLLFVVDDVEYEIGRSIDFGSQNTGVQKYLKVDGRVIDGGKIEATIERLLPEQISQFMLFDGELLNQFESLVVAGDTAQANGIKNAIEDTLGIPVLRKAESAIEKVMKELTRSRNEEMKKDNEAKLLAGKLSELEGLHENAVAQRDKAKQLLGQYKSESSDLRGKLDEAADALKLIERKKVCEELLARQKASIEGWQSELRQIAKDLWVIPLRETVAPIIEELKKELGDLNSVRDLAASKSLDAIKLRRSLEMENCQTCGSAMSDDQLEKIKSELARLEDELVQNIDTDDLIWQATTKLKKLSFSERLPDRRAEYTTVKKRLDKDRREVLQAENDIFDLSQQLKGVDEQTSQLDRNKYDSIIGEIAVVEDNINRFADEIAGCDVRIKQIRKSPEFARVSSTSDVVSQAERASQLKEVFERAIGLYRDEMRHKVEERASETFRHLTTEKTFDKLEINESYGLTLLVDGQVVNRSAGAEQIVAMSLIESLNYNGRRKGPMVMDTPVGRLDRKHRANILHHLPTVVTQLAIFAHSGELAEDDNMLDPNLVGQRYRIERRSTFHSDLIRL